MATLTKSLNYVLKKPQNVKMYICSSLIILFFKKASKGFTKLCLIFKGDF